MKATFVDGIGINKVNFFLLKRLHEPKVFLVRALMITLMRGSNFLVTVLSPVEKKRVDA